MDAHVMSDHRDRYTRRVDAGRRLLAHGARSQTASALSELTPDQLVTWRRRWKFNPEDRLRGPSPSSFLPFFSSLKHRGQATLFVCICRIVGILPARGNAQALKTLFTLENGERLCLACEIYRAWEPEAPFEFEHLVLLLTGAVEGVKVEFGECKPCDRAWLMDLMLPKRNGCPRCRAREGMRP